MCGRCGEFVVSGIAERWLRSGLNEARAEKVREITSSAAEGELLLIERDPLVTGRASTYSFTIKTREAALRG